MPFAPLARLGSTPAEPVAVLRRGADWIVATEPVEVVERSGPEAFTALDGLTPGFWAGVATYELGHAVEAVRPGRASAAAAEVGARLPGLVFARFARVEPIDSLPGPARPPAALGPARSSSLDRTAYLDAVGVVLEHIRAGDCYQVNLTRRLTWDTELDAAAFGALVRRRPAPHAALLVLPTTAGRLSVVSASPERFLAWRGRDVETRPIKGTGRTGATLVRSAKDRAENVMIVDLARNDLGRVCEPGTIAVPELCAVETHPGLAHLVSTVVGRRRDDVGIGRLLRATFPPASVTGAPKPRVLQIIEDLEPTPRGVYCGALGWIDTVNDTGDLAVAIRTFTSFAGQTTLGVGGGIVADSVPEQEWDETRLKARRLLARVGALEADASESIGARP